MTGGSRSLCFLTAVDESWGGGRRRLPLTRNLHKRLGMEGLVKGLGKASWRKLLRRRLSNLVVILLVARKH